MPLIILLEYLVLVGISVFEESLFLGRISNGKPECEKFDRVYWSERGRLGFRGFSGNMSECL